MSGRGVALRGTVLAVIGFLPTAHADGGGARAETLRVGRLNLALEAKAGVCLLRAAPTAGRAQTMDLGLPWPCGFHRGTTGEVRVIRSGGARYLLVESSKPAAPGSRDCDTRLRALRVTGTRADVSPHADRVAACPPFQWDGYVFRGLFE